MRIVITGATGFVGTALTQRLAERGDEVVVLSRSADRAQKSLPEASAAFDWDSSREPAPEAALTGAAAVIHLAGESVVGRWTDEKKKAIHDSRVIGTRHLVEGIAACSDRPRHLVSASAIGFYGNRGDELLTEESSPGDDFLARTCVAWEKESSRARDHGLLVAQLRVGLVLATGGGALGSMLLPFKLGLGGALGHGNQWWPWIHRADLVSMFLAAVDGSWEGVYNATSPQPSRQGPFARALGRVLRRPAILPAPAPVLRLLLGEFASELLSSHQVVPRRAQATGFHFAHPELEPALRDLLK